MVAPHHRLGRRLATRHLPQGAPTSPALANLCAFRLDARLAGLAASLGATYTRYDDDLVLSGGGVRTVGATVATIAAAEGFRLNERKSHLMTRAGPQRVTGVVVNERTNLARGDYDRLQAILHRVERDGLADVSAAELIGRAGWAHSLNPQRGAKLRAPST